MPKLEDLRTEYEHLFNSCVVKPGKFAEIDGYVSTIIANQVRYEAIGSPLGVPWYFVGIVHALECGLSFKKHLHNGDPLTARTINVPAGRPKTSQGPFTFEESAADALVFAGFNKVNDWSVAGILYLFEKYNGFGYRVSSVRIPSPYLWSYSNHYIKGKYSSDGKYDPELVSRQPGTATLLRRLAERQIISFGDQQLDRIKVIKNLATTVRYAPTVISEDARRLQVLLNEVGFPLLRDGKAGENTSNAVKQVTGKYLQDDPRLNK
jgi:lysozyme family protein